MSQTSSIILGTAGHIDHGKTALVKALTGIDTDRLKEERRRGITIELGFAHMTEGEVQFGIVDVPGHERFIKSMVAGAGGIDLVMLVVAADEGVMPQTREHLDICQLLGVRAGLLALTKADLVDDEWLELVSEDVRGALEGSFLEGAPMVPCSAHTGQGLDVLRQELLKLARGARPRDPGGLLRLPLDRVFTMKGFGTVVTGTLLSGTVSMGEDVAVLPGGHTGKVRGIQVHGEAVERAVAGQRTAINLGGVERQEVERGEVLVRPDTLSPSPMMDAEVHLLRGAGRGFDRRAKVLFHLGTRQQEASCILLNENRKLEPGGRALCQLRFETPVVALPGDRYIIRGFRKLQNYGTTVGGGVVLRVLSRKLKPRDSEGIELLGRMAGAPEDERVALELLGAGPGGLTRVELQQRLPMVPAAVDRLLGRLLDQRALVRFDRDSGAVVHRDHFDALRSRLLEITGEFHRVSPLEAGISREELRSRLGQELDPRLFHTLIMDLSRTGDLALERSGLCRLPSHQQRTAAMGLRPLADTVLARVREAGLGPPRDAELVAATGARLNEVQDALKLLTDEGKLLRITTLYFAPEHVARLQEQLVSFLKESGSITPPQFKEMVGQSRKFFIPLAEYFDAQKVTLRIGDLRKLRG